MEKLLQQVLRARRRLVYQQFLGVVFWSLFVAIMVAAAAVAVPKIWVMELDARASTIWTWSWTGGAVVVGLLFALVWTWFVRRGAMDAAVEIDHRYGLKERVSSTLSLSEDELKTEAGCALTGDAIRRVQRIDVREHFRIVPRWSAFLPILPAVAVLVLALLDDAVAPNKAEGSVVPVVEKKQIKKSAEDLTIKIKKRRDEATQKGLQDAANLFDKLERGIDRMSNKDDVDRKRAMVKLNDLAKELKQRREALGGSDQIRKQLSQLKNIKEGLADKMAKALKDGDFQKALDQMKGLGSQMQKGDLTDEQKAQLAEQLRQMEQALREMADAQRQAKEELEEQIKQAQDQGDLDRAGQLQQKLDQLNQRNRQTDTLQQMADKLGQCSQCLQQGNLQEAVSQLDQMAADLEDLQQQVDELEMIDDVMQQIAAAKDAMNCGNCGGKGCGQCQGQGMGQGAGKGKKDGPPGKGMGEGQGVGARPEEEDETGFYKSRVRADPGPGKGIIVGQVRGPNVAGKAREEIKSVITSARRESARPISGQRLPRAQREQTQQYFDTFREGED